MCQMLTDIPEGWDSTLEMDQILEERWDSGPLVGTGKTPSSMETPSQPSHIIKL